jgi:hypothetical protein
MKTNKLAYFILPLLLLTSYAKAQDSAEVAKLEAMVKALQAENSQLKSQLAKTDTQLEAQSTEIEEIRSEQRAERRELRQASSIGDGRDRAAGGDVEIGPFSFGGALRANYTAGDYDNDASGGGSNRDDDGTVTLDTFYLTSAFEYKDFIGAAEYRFYDSFGSADGYHFVHTAWLGKMFANGSTLKAGIVEVPFGLERFGTSYGFFNSLDNYVGLSDDRDLGIVYSFAIDDFEIDLGYFYSAEPDGSGNSKNSARGSYDIVEASGTAGALGTPIGQENNFLGGNYSPWEEKHQFNARVKYNFDLGETVNVVGASAQYGGLESTDPQDRFDDGHMYAGSVFVKSTWGNWQLKAGVTHYKYDIDQLKDKSTFAGTPFFTSFNGYNPDQIVIGGFDTPYFIAAEGTIPSIGISYTYITHQIDFIDYIIPYIDYSILIKEGETNGNYIVDESLGGRPIGTEYENSEQLTLGAMIGSGNWLIYVDTILGKGAPLVGNDNSQYFSGASLNSASDSTSSFDDGWQLRFNINVGYYF